MNILNLHEQQFLIEIKFRKRINFLQTHIHNYYLYFFSILKTYHIYI